MWLPAVKVAVGSGSACVDGRWDAPHHRLNMMNLPVGAPLPRGAGGSGVTELFGVTAGRDRRADHRGA
jgi:hypothetical protein